MNYYGNPMTRLIEELAALPGIGGKSAQRLAFHIINLPREKVAALSEAILAAKDEVKYCSVCCNLTEEEICPVCANPKRDHSVIMVVFMLCVLVCFPLEKEVRVSAASVIGMQFRERKI